MGWKLVAAVAKRAVISLGVIVGDDAARNAIGGVAEVGNLRRYEEEHDGSDKIYLLDL